VRSRSAADRFLRFASVCDFDDINRAITDAKRGKTIKPALCIGKFG